MGRIGSRIASLVGILLCLSGALVPMSGVTAQDAAVPEDDYSDFAPLATQALLLDATSVDGRLVAVGDHGIVLVSNDGGESWTQSLVPTRSMLTGVWFHDADLGWAVGHDAVILKTTDGGATWRRVNFQPDLLLPLFDVWFSDAENGIAIGPYGFVLTTADGGETWEESSLDAQPVVAETVVEEELVEKTGEVEKEAWEEDLSGAIDFHLNEIAVDEEGTLYIAAEAGQVYRSEDQGQTWVSLSTDYAGSLFSIVPLADEKLVVFGLRGNVFASRDGGLTWESVETPVDVALNAGTVTPDGTLVIVGMSGAILVSRDEGETYTLVQRDDRKAMTTVLAREDGGLLLFGEGGIVRLDSGEY
jgi:photosystem II stability/assembly factor-like uncharacterized protein